MAVLAALGGCRLGDRALPSPQRPSASIRAVWVTRWDFKSPEDIARVMEDCRRGGFNTVLFQVRGNGTALYRSRIEPWAEELGGRDPGFDPLAVACTEAHRRGLSLHAWVNVLPGWRGDKPPLNRRQLYNAHPDWFLRDAWNRRQPLGWYCSLNPCYPEVRRYLVTVMREIVAGYPVDGLHLDYIRFVNERSEAYSGWARVPDYPRDARTLALFGKATGKTPDTASESWNRWRAANVTQLVSDIRAMMRRVKPKARLSAAVGPSPSAALQKHFQDSSRWIADGLLDAVYPMNYAADMTTFRERVKVWASMRTPIPVVMGIMFDKRPPATVLEQIHRTQATGAHFAAFAYNSLFERSGGRPLSAGKAGTRITDAQSPARAALRRKVIPHLQQ